MILEIKRELLIIIWLTKQIIKVIKLLFYINLKEGNVQTALELMLQEWLELNQIF